MTYQFAYSTASELFDLYVHKGGLKLYSFAERLFLSAKHWHVTLSNRPETTAIYQVMYFGTDYSYISSKSSIYGLCECDVAYIFA